MIYDLDELRRKRAELDQQIAFAEKSKAEQRKAITLLAAYCKVVCGDCDGTGETSSGGADIESDPPMAETCGACHGEGFLYARKFEKKGRHDMDHNQVFPV